jgi:hypothetical protein
MRTSFSSLCKSRTQSWTAGLSVLLCVRAVLFATKQKSSFGKQPNKIRKSQQKAVNLNGKRLRRRGFHTKNLCC